MRPRKFVAKGSRHPKIHVDHNVPFKVALAFFFLGAAVIILTISLVALIVSVKARFDGLTASINSLTMKEEFQREYEKFILSRRAIENDLKFKLANLQRKESNGFYRVEVLTKLSIILDEFDKGLQEIKINGTEKYYRQASKFYRPAQQNCLMLSSRLTKIIVKVFRMENRIDRLHESLKLIDSQFTGVGLSISIKDSFPKNFQYYQLGGYPSPELLWSFLNWSPDLSLNRTFIQISDDVKKFGQSYAASHTTSQIESAFEVDYLSFPSVNFGSLYLKTTPNGNYNLKPDFSQIGEWAPKSRRMTIWKLKNY